ASIAADIQVVETRYAVPGEEGLRYLVLAPETRYVSWVNALGAPAGAEGASLLVPLERAGDGSSDGKEPSFSLLPVTAEAEGAFAVRSVNAPIALPSFPSATWYVVDDAQWASVAAREDVYTAAVYDLAGCDRAIGLGASSSAAVPQWACTLEADKYVVYVLSRLTLGLSLFTDLFV